ncbi:cysteine desulfurase [Candidatus Pacearchaeota archaeon]|nr:cysteine desulfurase [Candidatus Pacearchaeota archaeon]|tara:strand:+ start:1847 stop:3019 length:1173 start_codon:yes stop_codon:yes gene_type:complete
MDHKKDFPIFNKHKELIYLDSSATTQRPAKVINKLNKFHEEENANIHRGIYDLSAKATGQYEGARKTIAEFIKASEDEIIFTKGTTESLNLLAHTLPKLFKKKKEIVLTEMEHHSNIVPWQQTKMKLHFIKVKDNELDYEVAEKLITKKTAIVSITHVSNSLGTINKIEKIIKLAKKHGAIVIIDSAQSIAHQKINVKKLNCDFLVFSGHKTYGPFGTGILYGKKYILDKLQPFQTGGDMIKEVGLYKTIFLETPQKFEAGTQNISSVIGLAEAINYINEIGIENIQKHEKELTIYAIKELKKIPQIKLYTSKNQGPIISFTLGKIHPHDIASILNEHNLAIRAGHHCCMPLMKKLGIAGTARISLSIYNTKQDIDKLIKALKKAQEIFK